MISPRCTCGHSKRQHSEEADESEFDPGYHGHCDRSGCACTLYQPKRSLRVRAPIAKRSAKPKRKIMPKCRHCAHRYAQHRVEIPAPPKGAPCFVCVPCPGYQPARGIRQRRRTPAAALKLVADELWSQLVKAGRSDDAALAYKGCEVQLFYPHECVGGLQAMHGIPRTFAATRHLPTNGFAGCAGVHTYMTHRPELWSAVLLDAWGEFTFRELWSIARAMKPVDMEATVYKLREELAKVSA
jgi:hypothetical protein